MSNEIHNIRKKSIARRLVETPRISMPANPIITRPPVLNLLSKTTPIRVRIPMNKNAPMTIGSKYIDPLK
jgi:hypothetical protein